MDYTENGGHTAAAVGASQLAAAGVSGAWRLGRWDLLQSYLGALSGGAEVLIGEEVWEVQIGKLLSSLSSRYLFSSFSPYQPELQIPVVKLSISA